MVEYHVDAKTLPFSFCRKDSMDMSTTRMMIAALLVAASPALAQTTQDPFPQPINTSDGVIKANFVEFATLPDVNGQAARMMRHASWCDSRNRSRTTTADT